MADDLIVLDSVTHLGDGDAGKVAVVASHGGVYAAYVAARRRVRGVVLNDASVGKDGAGIAGLAYLDGVGIAAATVDYRSARIGDGSDMMADGIVSHVNETARALGAAPGGSCRALAALLVERAAPPVKAVPEEHESRHLLREGTPSVWALDSVSLVSAEDATSILLTGSHGGLLGGRPETALRHPALAAFYNDAGIGKDEAGVSRLPALDRRGIAALTVAASSARIGDARSTGEDGIVSRANATALDWGAKPGMSAREVVEIFVFRLSGKGP